MARGLAFKGMNIRVGMLFKHRPNQPFFNHKLCQQHCLKDARCRAYTYWPPGFQGAERAKCALKFGIPPAYACPQCISGVKLVASLPGRTRPPVGRQPASWRQYGQFKFRQGIAFKGRIIRVLTLFKRFPGQPFRNHRLCRYHCARIAQCRAYTLFPAGFGGSERARCVLKPHIQPTYPCPQCESGIKLVAARPVVRPAGPRRCPAGQVWIAGQCRCRPGHVWSQRWKRCLRVVR
jgi:hypothetical protein